MIPSNLYPADFVDILLIALLIYSLFSLFKKSRTRMIFFGLIILFSIYILALNLHLYMTTIVLQYFFGVSIVVFVILFQSEIRKYFETLGLFGARQMTTKSLAAKSPSITEIIQACLKMADSKTGALIVIRGHDSLDPLIEGGILLDGEISEEVLLSIFDHHSPGHDGALIISNNRIYKFSSHLPLSNNFREIGKKGTRHTAALGLSEKCDAICIVVSEERGQISVCFDGRLKTLDNPLDLERELTKFIKDKFLPSKEPLWLSLFGRNLPVKIGSLTAAGLLWFFTTYRTNIIIKNYSVPVQFTPPPESTQIVSYAPSEILLTVSGRGETTFRNIDDTSFDITLDITDIQHGVNKMQLNRQDIKQPLNLNLVSYTPEQILLTAKAFRSSSIPVVVKTSGQPAKGYQITNITITPDVINLWIPEDASAPAQIFTGPIDVTGLTDSLVTPADLVIPKDFKLVNSASPSANVAITIEK